MGYYQIQNGESATIFKHVQADVNGKHGAIILKACTLKVSGQADVDKTPGTAAGKILREEARGATSAIEGTVNGAPTYGAGGGAGGENVFSVVLSSTTTGGFSVGQYLRKKNASLATSGVYRVNTIVSAEAAGATTIEIECANNELDFVDTDVLERCIPEGRYRISVDVAQTDLSGVPGQLEWEIDGMTSAQRTSANDPAVTTEINEMSTDTVAPDNIALAATVTALADVQTDVDTLTTNLATADAAVDAVQVDVDALTTDVAAVQTAVDAISVPARRPSIS